MGTTKNNSPNPDPNDKSTWGLPTEPQLLKNHGAASLDEVLEYSHFHVQLLAARAAVTLVKDATYRKQLMDGLTWLSGNYSIAFQLRGNKKGKGRFG